MKFKTSSLLTSVLFGAVGIMVLTRALADSVSPPSSWMLPYAKAPLASVASPALYDALGNPDLFVGFGTTDHRIVIAPNTYNPNNYVSINTGTAPNGAGASITTVFQRGTAAAPTTVINGDELGFIQNFAYDGAAFNSTFPAAIVFKATETWTNTNHGTVVMFQGIPNGNVNGEIEVSIGNGLVSSSTTKQGRGVGTITADNGYYNVNVLLVSPVAPIIASGGCTTGSAQSISISNGSAAFEITLGGATCGSTITLTMPAGANNWVCDAHNITNPASNVLDMTGPASSTALVLTNFVRTTGVAGNFTGADKLAVKCTPY